MGQALEDVDILFVDSVKMKAFIRHVTSLLLPKILTQDDQSK